eukprot:5618192-Pleurochrysis_carterae.AAC.2
MHACRRGPFASGSPCANAIPCTIDKEPICCSTSRSVQVAVASDRQAWVDSVYDAMRRRARQTHGQSRRAIRVRVSHLEPRCID